MIAINNKDKRRTLSASSSLSGQIFDVLIVGIDELPFNHCRTTLTYLTNHTRRLIVVPHVEVEHFNAAA